MVENSAAAVNPSTPTTEAAPPEASQGALKEGASPKHKIKVDGQEFEVTQEELVALAQQGKSADKRYQSAAQMKREAEQILALAKENPTEFLTKAGKNAREWAEDYLIEELKREQWTPEQRKAHENEQKLSEYEKKEKQAKSEKEKQELQALEQQHMESYDKMFTEALTASGLPKTPFTVMRMAQLTLSADKRKIPVTAAQLTKIVREDYINEQKALFGAMDGNALLEMLGKDVVKKLSKAQLSQYKSSKVNNSVISETQREKKSSKPTPAEAWKAFKAKNRSL